MTLEARELRELSPEELQRKLEDTQRELFSLRLKVAGQQPNTAKRRTLRQDTARLKAVLAEKGVHV
ncbi:MAG: 50S ribosomal protein L29 [Armatimonadetes bacterium 13_1_40CM_64_14]|nr:MAG: 50S ribosomal protein L29 [Armatimonadetes bacterium 13_1_40CM_64_14]